MRRFTSEKFSLSMSDLRKRIEKRGICHYPDVSDENICIFSVDDFETPHPAWKGKEECYRGRTWFMVIFEDARPYTFNTMSSEPFATLEEAVRYAEKMVSTGIQWKDSPN
jgi:hypothetical protein